MSLSTARAQAAAADEGVFVDLQSHDASVRIDMVMGDGTTSPMCSVPCRKALPRAGPVRHPQRRSSRHDSPFLLPSDRSDLTLSVRPGSRAGRIAGMSLRRCVGAVAMVVGFMFSPADDFDGQVAAIHRPPGQPSSASGELSWQGRRRHLVEKRDPRLEQLRPDVRRGAARAAQAAGGGPHGARSGVLIAGCRRRLRRRAARAAAPRTRPA